MTKWARMKRRKEKRKAEVALERSGVEEKEEKPIQPEEISDNTEQYQETQKPDTPKTFKPNSILSQIPRYVYLIAIFALLSGVFFPLITTGADDATSFVIGGAAILFLGLAGGILIFKSTTSDNKRGIFLIIGLALITISLSLIFLIQDLWRDQFF